MTTIDAILPAGGLIDDAFAAKVGVKNKALIQFDGKTILRRTLDALEASGRVGETVVIGTEEVLEHEDAKQAGTTLPAGGSGPDNILKGLLFLMERPNPPDKVLIATTDMPFLTDAIIEDFLDKCASDCDIHVPLVTRDQYVARFPGSTANFVPLKDNVWTIGGAYVVDVQAFQAALPHVQKLFEQRKSKLGMAKLLGPVFLCRFLAKKLTVPMVEAKLKQILGCTGAPVLNCAPELAYDIDDIEDYEYAMKFIGGELTDVTH